MPQKCKSVKKYGHAPWNTSTTSSSLPPSHGLAGTYGTHILLTSGSAVFRVPDAIPDALASPINCALATMANAILNSSLLTVHQQQQQASTSAPSNGAVITGGSGSGGIRSALIQGAGMLGLYGAALLKRGLKGLQKGQPPFVAMTDVSQGRLDMAARFGADAAVCVAGKSDATVHAELMSALAAHNSTTTSSTLSGASDGFDLVLEVCGSPAALPLGLRCLRPGGEYVLIGLVHPDSAMTGVTAEAIIRKCAVIRGVHNYSPSDLQRAVAFLSETIADFPYSDLISPPLPLSQLPSAVALAKEGRYARVCVVPDGEGMWRLAEAAAGASAAGR